MVSTGLPSLDEILEGEGYPDRSAVLVTGAPGVGKEAMCYSFIQSGLSQGDFCLYVTRLSAREILRDAKAFGVDFQQRVPFWIAAEGGEIKYDHSDLAKLSYEIKDTLRKNGERRIRVVADFLSALLTLNPPDVMYKFSTELLTDIKQHDAVLLATLEEGMHQPQVTTTMQSIFDGVFEMRVYEEGLSYVPTLKVRKMMGVAPIPGYFVYSFSKKGMEISAIARHV